MTSISSVSNMQTAAISSYKTETELSSSTKLKLEALGIDPSTVTSEAQAQTLIAQAEAAKHQNNAGQQQQGGNSSEQELLSEAKNLASQIGVTVSCFSILWWMEKLYSFDARIRYRNFDREMFI